MKRFIVISMTLGFAFLSFSTSTQAGWLTNFEKTKQEAKEKKCLILADFSGSDWCRWCTKLKREVFSKPAFKAFAKNNLILFVADFPRKEKQSDELKKQNQILATTYAIRGFPTVLLLNASGKELARTGYCKGGAEAYVEHLQALIKGTGHER